MNYYDGKVNLTTPRTYFTAGRHRVAVKRVLEKLDGLSGKFFIIETTKLESSATGCLDEPSRAIPLAGKYPDSDRGEIYAFLGACFGLVVGRDDARILSEITPDVIRACVHESNPLAGVELWVTGHVKPGKSFCNVAWAPCSPISIPRAGASAPRVPPVGGAFVPPAPPAAPTFPPHGWLPHPTAPGYYYSGQRVLTEAALRAEPPF